MTDKDKDWQDYKDKRRAELEAMWASGHRLTVGKDGRLVETEEPKFELSGRYYLLEKK